MAEDKPKRRTNNREQREHREQFSTNSGHPLTPQEAKFIDEYIVSGNGRQSVINAGYKSKSPSQYAQTLLNKDYITEEINYRLEQAKNEKIADATEVMEYFTKVMRGEESDQFGLEAPLSERTRCAQELAKRLIDIPNRAGGGGEPPKLTITVDWGENASASIEEIGESVDTSSIADLYDTKKRDNLE